MKTLPTTGRHISGVNPNFESVPEHRGSTTEQISSNTAGTFPKGSISHPLAAQRKELAWQKKYEKFINDPKTKVLMLNNSKLKALLASNHAGSRSLVSYLVTHPSDLETLSFHPQLVNILSASKPVLDDLCNDQALFKEFLHTDYRIHIDKVSVLNSIANSKSLRSDIKDDAARLKESVNQWKRDAPAPDKFTKAADSLQRTFASTLNKALASESISERRILAAELIRSSNVLLKKENHTQNLRHAAIAFFERPGLSRQIGGSSKKQKILEAMRWINLCDALMPLKTTAGNAPFSEIKPLLAMRAEVSADLFTKLKFGNEQIRNIISQHKGAPDMSPQAQFVYLMDAAVALGAKPFLHDKNTNRLDTEKLIGMVKGNIEKEGIPIEKALMAEIEQAIRSGILEQSISTIRKEDLYIRA